MAWVVSFHMRWCINSVYPRSRTTNKTPVEILPNKEVYVVKNTETNNSTEIHAISMPD